MHVSHSFVSFKCLSLPPWKVCVQLHLRPKVTADDRGKKTERGRQKKKAERAIIHSSRRKQLTHTHTSYIKKFKDWEKPCGWPCVSRKTG